MWADECAVLREGEEKDEEVGDDGGVLGGAPNDGDDDGSNDIQVVPIEINNDAQVASAPTETNTPEPEPGIDATGGQRFAPLDGAYHNIDYYGRW